MLPALRLSMLCCLLLAAWAQAESLTDTLKANKNLSQFATLLMEQYRPLYANLSYSRDVTLLLPNDGAFEKIPYSTLGTAFMNNESDIVRSVLEYHVLSGRHPASSFNSSFQFGTTWLSNNSYTNVTGGQKVGVVEQAGDVTVVTSGVGSRSTIMEKDLEWKLEESDGIIHIIDTFLTPPRNFISTCPQFNLTAFGGMVTNASRLDYANEHSDLTIFATNNDGVQRVGSELATMSADDLGELVDYHIVNGSQFVGYSSNLRNGTTLQTRQGKNITITYAGNSMYADSSLIVQPDLLISNGVIHVINNVLDPAAAGVKPIPSKPTQAAVIQGSALPSNVLPYASDLPSTVSSFASSAPGADATSFGLSDIGSGSTTSEAFVRSTRTSQAGAVVDRDIQGGLEGMIFGAAMALLAYL